MDYTNYMPAGDVIQGGAGNDVLFGSNGDDLIRGGEGDDTLKGLQGNDVLIGDQGSDLMEGGYGDDRMVWNNGDGSDIMEGGNGFDVTEFNGSVPGGDELVLQSNWGRALFDRVNLGPITLDVDDVEQFEINGLGGDDTLTVKDLSGTDVQQVIFNGGDGNDFLDASQTAVNILAIGGDGSDTLIGGSGNDTIIGGNLDAADPLLSGLDYMTSGGGSDTYSLGDAQYVYYNSQGEGDYAVITDYNAGWDKIELNGGVEYQLQDYYQGSDYGSAIYTNGEMIGWVQGYGSDSLQIDYAYGEGIAAIY
ncbi:calcium-binding protein [Lyngbya aestuarii]|uniref:calcium-binding protein n=1 Tax=Lyngbya aestuarii TaxID=118322 RepID=UPI00403E1648